MAHAEVQQPPVPLVLETQIAWATRVCSLLSSWILLSQIYPMMSQVGTAQRGRFVYSLRDAPWLWCLLQNTQANIRNPTTKNPERVTDNISLG